MSIYQFLVAAGMEVDLAAVRRRSKTALGVSLGGLAVPFAPAGVTDD